MFLGEVQRFRVQGSGFGSVFTVLCSEPLNLEPLNRTFEPVEPLNLEPVILETRCKPPRPIPNIRCTWRDPSGPFRRLWPSGNRPGSRPLAAEALPPDRSTASRVSTGRLVSSR